MKLKDILNESVTDVVARFYLEASEKYDKFYNPEDIKYKEKNHVYYEDHFKGWFKEGQVPVFTKPTVKPQPEYTPIPKDGKVQSPGYRGLQMALARSGNEYDHKVQRYEPNLAALVAPSQGVAGGRGSEQN
jgi:hypothetical protein